MGADAAAEEGDDYLIGQPVRQANLTVFPVLSRVERNEDRYTTLDEGLKSGKVQVFERGAAPSQSAAPNESHASADASSLTAEDRSTDDAAAAGGNSDASPIQDGGSDEEDPFADDGDEPAADEDDPFADDGDEPAADEQIGPQVESAEAGESRSDDEADALDSEVEGDVNRLVVINTSGKPLYLMPGEIIVGGKQDRCIARESIVPSDGAPIAIEVYCVEHGRWHGRGQAGYSDIVEGLGGLRDESEATGPVADLARAADRGRFIASAGSVSKSARLAAQAGKGQHDIWDEVAGANAANQVESSTGAFTDNYVDAESLEKLQPYLDALSTAIADQPGVVGVLVAINGEVESIDVFESTPLFRKLWPKLLKSHALDAASVVDEAAEETDVSLADARAFLDEASRADVEKTDTADGLTVTSRSTGRVVSFSAHGEEVAAESEGGMGGGIGGGGGGFGGVHSVGFAK